MSSSWDRTLVKSKSYVALCDKKLRDEELLHQQRERAAKRQQKLAQQMAARERRNSLASLMSTPLPTPAKGAINEGMDVQFISASAQVTFGENFPASQHGFLDIPAITPTQGDPTFTMSEKKVKKSLFNMDFGGNTQNSEVTAAATTVTVKPNSSTIAGSNPTNDGSSRPRSASGIFWESRAASPAYSPSITANTVENLTAMQTTAALKFYENNSIDHEEEELLLLTEWQHLRACEMAVKPLREEMQPSSEMSTRDLMNSSFVGIRSGGVVIKEGSRTDASFRGDDLSEGFDEFIDKESVSELLGKDFLDKDSLEEDLDEFEDEVISPEYNLDSEQNDNEDDDDDDDDNDDEDDDNTDDQSSKKSKKNKKKPKKITDRMKRPSVIERQKLRKHGVAREVNRTDQALNPRDRRKLLDQSKAARKYSLLRRKSRLRMKKEDDEMDTSRRLQFLKFVQLARMANTLSRAFVAKKTDYALAEQQEKAASLIQITWEIYFAPLRAERKKNVQMALMKYSMRLLNMLNRVRRRIATRKVVTFYRDFSKQKMAYVMIKFRFNCVKLQRRIRSYNQVTNARLLLLDLKWDLIEASVRDRVENSVYGGEGGGKSGNNKWKQKLRLTEFPELGADINHATTNVINLKKSIESGIKRQRSTLPAIIKSMEKRERMMGEFGGRDPASAALLGEEGETELNVDNLAASLSQFKKKGGKRYKSLIAPGVKSFALKNYLTNRRISHGFVGWDETHGTSVKAQEIDVLSALAILKGQLSIHDHFDYTVSKKAWPMMMLLTDHEGNLELTRIIEQHVKDHFVAKNAEIQKIVKARFEKEESQKKLQKMMSRGRGKGLFKTMVKSVIHDTLRQPSENLGVKGGINEQLRTALRKGMQTEKELEEERLESRKIHADLDVVGVSMQ